MCRVLFSLKFSYQISRTNYVSVFFYMLRIEDRVMVVAMVHRRVQMLGILSDLVRFIAVSYGIGDALM